MPFRFRLEKILSITRMKETMKQMEVAAVQGKIEILKSRKRSAEQSLSQVLHRGMEYVATHWTVFHREKVKMDLEQIRKLEQDLTDEAKVLAERKAELGEIVKRRKALEAFRDKKESEYRVESSRKEQKRLEENHQLARQSHKTI